MHRLSMGTIVLLVAALLVALSLPAAAQERSFTTTMSGDEEVPAVETDASGEAQFVLNADGTEISFSVDVADLEDTTMAHIHLAPAGENGPPVVWLHSQAQEPELVPGMTTGTLATGTFSADDLVGPLEDGTLEDLVEAMAAGDTYVNVHTEEFPDGEIRGQIAEVTAEEDDEAEEPPAEEAEDAEEAEEIEQPDRIDTGAGGTAGSSGASLLVLSFGIAVGLAVTVALRRRTTT